MVLKRFEGRTNILLMILFPWLDWDIDISDFEKIDFLGHRRFSGVPSPWAGSFFASATLKLLGRKISKSAVRKQKI